MAFYDQCDLPLFDCEDPCEVDMLKWTAYQIKELINDNSMEIHLIILRPRNNMVSNWFVFN